MRKEWHAALAATAAELRAAEEVESRRMTLRANQATLDERDGRVLHLMTRIIGIFDAAHEVDRKIPRLQAIATAGVLRRKKGAEASEEVAEE